MMDVHTTDDEPKNGAKTREPTISKTMRTNPETKTMIFSLTRETILLINPSKVDL